MVKSKINPDKVEYKEDIDVDDEDIGVSSWTYSYTIHNTNIEFALGKEKHTFSNKCIVYFHIYLLVNDSPVANIGIFEVEQNRLISIIDEEGYIDLNKGNLLIFKFVNEEFIKNEMKETKQEKSDKEIETIEKSETKEDEENDEENPITDEEDVLKLRIPQQSISKEKEKTDKILKDGIFMIEKNEKIPMKLQEETEADSNNIKSEYKESNRTTWIEKCMANNNYDIVETAKDGDCFFSTILEAYKQIGHMTTVDKLRAILSNEVTDEIYNNYRVLYLNFLGELQTKEKEMKDLKKISTQLKKKNDAVKTKEETKEILDEAKRISERYNVLKAERDDVKEMMTDFDFMSGVDSLEKLREFIKTPNYWADTWAISTIEKVLNVKIIILSKESYDADDLDSVLQCGQLNDSDLEKQGNFSPDFYIMAGYLGNHYDLITYKNKRIFAFTEIPYDIKALIINKCMEKNAGPYYLIRDFRNFKSKLGLSPDEGAPTESDDVDMEYELYDPEIIFEFHSKSDCKPKAGKGSGEKIPDAKLTEYNSLNKDKDKICDNWRRKLDDTWMTQFTLDGHRWASVEHYYLASQYKKGFPDFYKEFSLDSESDISKDIELAKVAGGKTGKLKDKQIRPKNVKVDEDFFEIKENPRFEEARKNAIQAKFTQNLDLKKILMETKNAKLVHFVRRSPPVPDEPLMKLRKEMR